MEHQNHLAANLLFLRKLHRLPQAEMQAHTGIEKATRATWSNWENGNTEPDLATLIQIAKFFRISLDDIIQKNLEEEGNLINGKESLQKGNLKGNGNGNPNTQKGLNLAEVQGEYSGQEWNNKQLTQAVFAINSQLAEILEKLGK
jgi:transcriptional regulator with XRE-family HTH domain